MIKLSKKNYDWIRQELKNGEIIIWAGQSSSKMFFDLTYGFLWFSIVIVCLISFILKLGGIDASMVSFIIAIFIIVIFIFVESNRQSLMSLYLITNMRIIFLKNTNILEFNCYYPHQLNNIERQPNGDGSGNITFITNLQNPSMNRPSIMGIEDVNKVGDLLNRLADKNISTLNKS